MKNNKLLIAALLLSLSARAEDTTPAAAEADAAAQLDAIQIKAVADIPATPANVPSTVESFTSKQISESVNSVSSAGALLYVPGVHVRERFIGDVNGGLAMRMYGVNSSAETIVYADGLLLSNFLNNSCCPGPRWSMVPQSSIDRVDVMYGPFSALYPGNSVGGVVLMSTHMPDKFEAHAKLDTFGENFKLYGTDKNFYGVHGSAMAGDKEGDFSFWVSGDHLDNHSHPTDFTAATRRPAGVSGTNPAAVLGVNTTIVTGAYYDKDIANNTRVNTAAISADHTVKDDATIKLAYDITPTLRATYTLDVWQNRSNKEVDSYLRDAAGNTVYGTATGATVSPFRFVRIDGVDYNVTAPSVSLTESLYHMHGLSLKSSTGGTWDWELTTSYFNQDRDVIRASSGNFGTTASSDATAGTITYGDGTGWHNLDLRGEWRPDGNLKSQHQISFGFHTDRYKTKSDQYNLVSGRSFQDSPANTLSTNSRGVTTTDAIYLQDAWQITPGLKLVVGGREEKWEAYNGSNFANNANKKYEDKTVYAFSPKASLSIQLSDDWELRSSYGRGVRFPTVNELFKTITVFQGLTASGTAATAGQVAALPAPYNAGLNNPNLKPETADSWEFALERQLGSGLWRTSVFGEEKEDALVSQTDNTSLANVTAGGTTGFSFSSVQNIDKVRTYGLETALQASSVFVHGFDLSGSITYVHDEIVKDRANPGLEHSQLPLIPVVRATLLGVYHASEALSYSLGWRYSGRQHSGLYNSTTHIYPDPNPGVYGGRSNFSVFDAKVLYKLADHVSASIGVDNITNEKYFTLYPYAQRTFYATAKFDY